MARPAVDVVVPFSGDRVALERLRVRLSVLRLEPQDTVTIVDNSSRAVDELPAVGRIAVLRAAEWPTPGYARNSGARHGRGEWVVFLDSDTAPRADLLDRFFDPPPGEDTALLAGGVTDEEVPHDAPAAARYAYLHQSMSQRHTFRLGAWAFAQTVNVACRRSAFDDLGGFREDIRSGEDADLTYRLKGAGWQVERREPAAVVHFSRKTIRGFVAQKAVHGQACGWLDRVYPGSFPARRRPGLLWWALRASVRGVYAALCQRERDVAVLALFDALEQVLFEFGRSLPNGRRPRVR